MSVAIKLLHEMSNITPEWSFESFLIDCLLHDQVVACPQLPLPLLPGDNVGRGEKHEDVPKVGGQTTLLEAAIKVHQPGSGSEKAMQTHSHAVAGIQ